MCDVGVNSISRELGLSFVALPWTATHASWIALSILSVRLNCRDVDLCSSWIDVQYEASTVRCAQPVTETLALSSA